MNGENKNKIAITICSGLCLGEELLRHDPQISGLETLVGYSTIEKVREERETNNISTISNNSSRVIDEEDEPIV